MVERRNCSFCGSEIEPGTGSLYIRKDAVMYNFCSNKCRKNQIAMGRIPRRTRWTKAFMDLKAAGKSKEARARPEEGEEPEGVTIEPKKKAAPKAQKKNAAEGVPVAATKTAKPEVKPSEPQPKPSAKKPEPEAAAKPKVAAKKPKAEPPK